MRILAILFSIILFVGACLGGAAWWVTQPMRFAGIERDPARFVSRGELVEAERPDITRLEIVDLLREREFEVLTRIIETRNERALADPKEEWELGRVMDAFEIRDDSLADEFDEWIQASPKSFAPLLASAKHRFVMAFVERGTRTAAETTREQFAGMQQQLALLFEDAAAALRHEPRLSEAYVTLIDASRSGGTQNDCGNFAKIGLDVMPASFRVRMALAVCRLPRWGGSYQRIEAIAKAADPFFADNSALAALHGVVEWDKGRVADGRESLRHYDEALKAGPLALFHGDRAAALRDEKKFQEALDEVDAALELDPDEPEFLVDRLYDLLSLGRNDEIPEIVELVEALDPLNARLPRFRSYALEVAAYEANKMKGGAASVDRVNQGIALSGGDSMAYLVRGRGYLQAGDEARALADFQTAIRLDPTNFTAYLNVDALHARRGQWQPILEMWDAYLEKYPNDGRAVWQRAGTIRHSGNEIRAFQEAKKACDMGVKEACAAVVRRP